jgi:tetratricopeptide (TPR) repeat protein
VSGYPPRRGGRRATTSPVIGLDAVRRLLWHLRDPQWIRRNLLVYGRLSDTVDAASDDYVLMRSLRAVVADALATLPARARSIVERTALGGESCRAVARSLGISERQLHRNRSAAVWSIAVHLSREPQRQQSSRAVAQGVLELRLAHAWALAEVGSFDSAETQLADAARASDDAVVKTSVLGQLARLCLERGRISAARGHSDLALHLAEETGEATARADARVTAARISALEGDVRVASEALRSAVIASRPLAFSGDDVAKESLCHALVGQWEVFRIKGQAIEAYAAAREAVACARQLRRPVPSLKMAAGAAVADALGFLWTDPAMAEAETQGYYAAAQAGGYVRSALHFATLQAGIAHLKGRYAEALCALSALLPVASRFPSCTTKAYFFSMLGVAQTLAGATHDALASLEVASDAASTEYRRLCGYLSFSRATAQLGSGDACLALSSVDEALPLLSSAADVSLLGACLNKKTQALIALRRFPAALSAAEESLALLERWGHPINLQDARLMVGKLRRAHRTSRAP